MSGRIFILTQEPPENPGGAEHLVRELKRGLEERGRSVEVLHEKNCMPRWLNGRRNGALRYLADTLASWRIGRRLEKRMAEDVAAVISNGPVGWYLPRRRKKAFKRVHFYHGTYRAQAEAIRPFITLKGYLYLKWWASMVLERASGRGKVVVCNSDQTRDEVARFFGYKGATVWLPLDTEQFKPRDARECRRRLGLPENRRIGLFVGNVSPMKNFPLVRRVMGALPDVEWVLALRGSVSDELSEAPGVHVFGNAAGGELPLLYSAADFALCPSFYEPFGYVVAEALACGTPVIASSGGASRLLLREPPLNGLLIEDANAVDAFVDAATEILKDPAFYRQAVLQRVRPRLEQVMAPENWWRRFFEVTGL